VLPATHDRYDIPAFTPAEDNNSVKNELISIILGEWNPKEISHQSIGI